MTLGNWGKAHYLQVEFVCTWLLAQVITPNYLLRSNVVINNNFREHMHVALQSGFAPSIFYSSSNKITLEIGRNSNSNNS